MILPSILSADFGHLASEVQALTEAGCKMLHVDVMDGHFVPNLTIGPVVVKSLRKWTTVPFDMHLMVTDPLKYAEPFLEACGDVAGSSLCVHLEVLPCPAAFEELCEKVHRLYPSVRAGIAINPKTPAESLRPYLAAGDEVVVMSVEPGFGGQAAIESCFDKIPQIRAMEQELSRKAPLLIAVDGGVKLFNLDRVKGADLIVMGSAVFGKSPEETAGRFCEAQEALRQLQDL